MNLSSIIIPKGECKYRPSIMCYPINIEVKHQTFYKQKSSVIIDMYKFHIKIVIVDLRPQISMLVGEKGSSNNRFLSILYEYYKHKWHMSPLDFYLFHISIPEIRLDQLAQAVCQTQNFETDRWSFSQEYILQIAEV